MASLFRPGMVPNGRCLPLCTGGVEKLIYSIDRLLWAYEDRVNRGERGSPQNIRDMPIPYASIA